MSSSLKYAEKYAILSSEQSPAIVIAATIPGNSFPVVEPANLNRGKKPLTLNSGGYLGKACRPATSSQNC